jgi:malate dehydrogenase
MHAAPDVPQERFHAMTRLDENRAKAQLAKKAGVTPGEIGNLGIWGNHSDTMYPDYPNALIGGKPVTEVISDREWLDGAFTKTVATRGKAIIEARGLSSAASAASAALDHMHDLWHGTPAGGSSMAIVSDGSYGVAKGLISSFPVTAKGGNWQIVQGIEHSEGAKARIAASVAELESERATVADLLG